MVISRFITDLTGIDQELIDGVGLEFKSAYTQFVRFCENGALPVYSWGSEEEIFRENCILNAMEFSDYTIQCLDIRPIYAKAGIDINKMSSGTIHQRTKTPLRIHPHDAMCDVLSLAIALTEVHHFPLNT